MKKNIFLIAVLFAASSLVAFVGCANDEEVDYTRSCWEIICTFYTGGNRQTQNYYRWGTTTEVNEFIKKTETLMIQQGTTNVSWSKKQQLDKKRESDCHR